MGDEDKDIHERRTGLTPDLVEVADGIRRGTERSAAMMPTTVFTGQRSPCYTQETAVSASPVSGEGQSRSAPVPPSGLRKGARNILSVLTKVHPRALTGPQLMLLVPSMKAATFSTYLSTLKASGVVEETVDGFRAVDGPSVSLTREQMQQLWESALRAGARDMLRTVMSVYPEAITTSTLKTSVRSMTATTFATYLSTLRSCGLITVSDDRARAADWLFN